MTIIISNTLLKSFQKILYDSPDYFIRNSFDLHSNFSFKSSSIGEYVYNKSQTGLDLVTVQAPQRLLKRSDAPQKNFFNIPSERLVYELWHSLIKLHISVSILFNFNFQKGLQHFNVAV